ncbi:MAG TPA: LacI family DNA-binding transcriptional regulator [Candidatus Limnocylindrales bacterium]|nr:LacI family DNA-binding transcriptional regulator [Candidatus Limnocylindrales bacterium]
MRITIGDVAKRAGVGRGTVSRVLNNRPNVDPETRARVQAVIDELDFVPSTAARRLSLGWSQTVAVVVPFLTRPSTVERLRGIESGLVAAGLDMLAMNVESTARRDAILRDIARPERIDGLILVSIAPHEDELGRITGTGLPVVLVDAHHRRLPRVVTDDVGGGRIAARHLLELGHRRLGFVGDAPRPGFGFASSRLRLLGVRQALRAEGLALRGEDIGLAEHGRAPARASAEIILAGPERPTAIVAASDTEAMGVLEAAAGLGLSVPDDLSVVGYDDIEAAGFIGLTTVRQPLCETGERAVRRLVDRIAGIDDQPLREVLPVTLVVRRTTGAPAGR